MKFKINDRVRTLYSRELAREESEEIAELFSGKIATIIEVHEADRNNPYKLKFDVEQLTESGNVWWSDEELELVQSPSIQNELEKLLNRINRYLEDPYSQSQEATLLNVKANVLIALQKYE